jgi:hypothetical protein
MATGFTQTELDVLLAVMDRLVPPIPTDDDRAKAQRVTATRTAGTDKGIIVNIETKRGKNELFWFNVWVAKEMAAAISFASRAHEWSKRRYKLVPCDHLHKPEVEDLADAPDVLSLSTFASHGGILMRLAIGRPSMHVAMFFPISAALELMNCAVQAGTLATWWGDDFELIPSQESQH